LINSSGGSGRHTGKTLFASNLGAWEYSGTEYISVAVLRTEGFDSGKPQKGIANSSQGELCR